ncbi:hypothetical protein BGZ97_000090 [Linnemannia gamsii]|uniref:Uncharacterized protein n=1 Tax=Linnemannia gamsii TaxID=64522 RepID=A0A9P6R355_9FUNG|nr:hypothetical protein BGZ97_000090 [Linnemannia gamsii]
MAMGSPKQIRTFPAINAGSALFNGTSGMMGNSGGGGYEGAGNGGSGGGGGGYLCVNNDESTPTSSQASDFDNQSEAPTPVLTSASNTVSVGNKTEFKDDQDYAIIAENAILKSSSQNQPTRQHGNIMSRRSDQQQQQSQQHQLPLRTTNKPTPPHDPFRKTSLSGTNRAPFQSLYQQPEPPYQGDIGNHPLPQQLAYYQDPSVNSRVPSIPGPITRIGPIGAIGGGVSGGGGALGLTATGRILSSIGGMSGCYGIVGGVPHPAMIGAGLPTITTTATYKGSSTGGSALSPPSSSKQRRQQLQHQQQKLQREQQQLQHQQRQLQQLSSSIQPYGSGVFQATPHQSTPSSATSASTKSSRTSSSYGTSIGGKRIGDRKAVDFRATHIPTSTVTDAGLNIGDRHTGKQHQQYMPDIVLTLPTPAESGLVSRKEGYFAM